MHEKYLRLPTFVGHNKRDIFNMIRDIVQKKLQSWRWKLFLIGEKEVLIKVVTLAIPSSTT